MKTPMHFYSEFLPALSTHTGITVVYEIVAAEDHTWSVYSGSMATVTQLAEDAAIRTARALGRLEHERSGRMVDIVLSTEGSRVLLDSFTA